MDIDPRTQDKYSGRMGKPQPKEQRLTWLGVTALRPGERTVAVRIRGADKIIRRFEALSPEERGRVIEAGFSREGVKNG